jgi:hypothetical protein
MFSIGPMNLRPRLFPTASNAATHRHSHGETCRSGIRSAWAMRIGAVTVPLATALPENSIQLIAEHAGCKVLVADETNWEKASHVAASLGATRPLSGRLR